MVFAFPLLLLVACAGTSGSVGVGVYSPAIKAVSNSDDGSAGILAPLSYPIGVKAKVDLGVPIILATDYTPTAKPGPESEITSRYTLIRAMVVIAKGLSLGPSLSMHTQKGSGEVLELNNGGSTAEFATPDTSSTSSVLGLNLAYEYAIGSVILGNEIFWQGFMSMSRWNFAWLASLQYRFGGGR